MEKENIAEILIILFEKATYTIILIVREMEFTSNVRIITSVIAE